MSHIHLRTISSVMIAISLTSCSTTTTSYIKPNHQELIAVRTLAVKVSGNPEFTHTGAITSESSGLILFCGLSGAVFDTAVRSGRDKNTADTLKAKATLARAHQNFADTLTEKLQKSGDFEIVKCDATDVKKNNFDALLHVDITTWGSRIKQSESDVIIPFMVAQISMTNLRNNKLIWRETQTITHDSNHTLQNYQSQKGLFTRDFETLINKAATQVDSLLLSF